MLAFYSTQLCTALKIIGSTAHREEPPNYITLKSVSQSISAFIESRFQYSILFCNSDTLDYFFNIHKRVIAAVLGRSPSFFGFKWRTSTNSYVTDLFEYLDNLCSDTYLRLCQLAGRPSLLDIARRASRVIEEQTVYGRNFCLPQRPVLLV